VSAATAPALPVWRRSVVVDLEEVVTDSGLQRGAYLLAGEPGVDGGQQM
jgi:hypothetical protein